MATKHSRTSADKNRGIEDSRGNVRIVVDLPKNVAQEFAVLAIRRGETKRALMARLIMNAVAGK